MIMFFNDASDTHFKVASDTYFNRIAMETIQQLNAYPLFC